MMKDFFTNENETRFNEVVFQNRHKNYGAYVLRNEESLILRKALFIGVSLFVAISVVPILMNSFKNGTETVGTESGPINLKPIDEVPDKPKDIEKPTVVPPKQIEKTVSLVVPTPTKNPEKETPAVSQKEIEKSAIGNDTHNGVDATNTYKPIETTANTAPTTQPTVQPIDKKAIIEHTDVDANFNGGINAFRNKLQSVFDTSDFDGIGETMSTTVTFVVETDGTITNIKANGNDAKFNAEAERAIREIKGIWTPAKLKGESVRSRFRFPISMKFD